MSHTGGWLRAIPADGFRFRNAGFGWRLRLARCFLGGVDKLAMLGEKVSLGLVDRSAIPVDLPL